MQMIERRGRLLELDGLRTIAITAVFIHHALGTPLLWAGVDLFFVLSGYLITSGLLQSKDRGDSAKAFFGLFYARRTLRIFPAYYLSIAFAMALVPTLSTEMLPWAVSYTGNVYRAAVGDPSALMPLWSLAVEEQFYLIWPLLIWFTPARYRQAAIATVLTVAPALRFAAHEVVGGLGAEALLTSRMDSLAVGGMIALYMQTRGQDNLRARRQIYAALAAVALVAMAAIAASVPNESPVFAVFVYEASVLGFGATVCATIGYAGERPTSVLRWTPVVYLGQISYGIYLYHYPILLWLAPRVDNTYLRACLAACLTLAIAVASFHLVEDRVNRLKHRLPSASQQTPLRRSAPSVHDAPPPS